MRQCSMKEMFEEAFGLNVDTMEVQKPYNVSEANVGILGLSKEGEKKLHRVLYAIKKKKAKRFAIEVEGFPSLICSSMHRIAIRREESSPIEWVFAKDLPLLLKKHIWVETELGARKLKDVKRLPPDYTLDVQVESAENYYSNGLLSHNSMYGPDFTTTGGYAIKYYSSWRGRITRIDDIKEKGVTVGIISKVRNIKNKIGVPKREAELELRFASGFDSDSEYLKFIVDLGIVEQRGAWFYQEEWGFKGNGRDSVLAFLKENPDLFNTVKNSVNMMLCEENSLDANNDAQDNREYVGYDDDASNPNSLAEQATEA